jgi:hypothetical protein
MKRSRAVDYLIAWKRYPNFVDYVDLYRWEPIDNGQAHRYARDRYVAADLPLG